MIGGKGKKRTPALAARYADEFNLPFVSEDVTGAQFGRVREACADIGRDPDELVYSNALVLCCGATRPTYAAGREAIGRDVDDLRANGLAGTPAEVVDRIGRFADAGSQRVYLQIARPRRPRPPRAGRERGRAAGLRPRHPPGQAARAFRDICRCARDAAITSVGGVTHDERRSPC